MKIVTNEIMDSMKNGQRHDKLTIGRIVYERETKVQMKTGK